LDNFVSNGLEIMSEMTANQCESGIWNLLHRKQVVQLEDELAVMMMGSKDCSLSNFTLF
jgi:hypothetical protein